MISSLFTAASRRKVAFSASGVEGHNIPANGTAIIPFPQVITNVGDAYNPTTSVFTAPYDGDYFFVVNMDVSPDYEQVQLTHNGHTVIIPDKDDTVVTHLSGSVVITLKAGDVIAIQHMSRDRATNSRHVAFTAYISDEPGIQVTVPHAVVPFRGVINIVGNAYNPATSAFTAPYDGDYFFIVHADVSPDYRSMEVRKNDVRVFAGDNDNHDGHVTASGVLRLKAGDVITATHYTHATGAANRRRVAFSATGVEGHNIRANGSAIIPFPHVITNVGNAYNPTTSVFTAPYDGDYFFIVNMDVSHDYEAVLLTRNGHMTVDNMQGRLTSQEEKIAHLEAVNQRRVAFSAAVGASNVPASGSSIIPFTTIITNVGNAYNPTTSVFTAPYDGDYFFILNVDVSLDYESMALTHNGHAITYADKDDKTETHVSGSAVISMKTGDVISVNHYVNDVGYVEGGIDSTFTGFYVR
nr:hypothetical protein BaRGS_029077 [Batillaria attramentaria]